MLWYLIVLAVVGFVARPSLARAILPGDDSMGHRRHHPRRPRRLLRRRPPQLGLIMQPDDGETASPRSSSVGSVFGAVIVLMIYRAANGRQRHRAATARPASPRSWGTPRRSRASAARPGVLEPVDKGGSQPPIPPGGPPCPRSPLTFGVFFPQGWKMELASIDGPAGEVGRPSRSPCCAEELRLRLALVVRPLPQRRPCPAHETMFECWTVVAAISQRTSPHPARPDGRLHAVPQPRPAGEDHLHHRRHLRRPPLLGHRRRLVRARVQGLRLRLPRAQGPHRRCSRETVEIVKAMWTEPDVTYSGTYYDLKGAQCDPKPLQDPHPPILIGGGGEQLTLAGRRPPRHPLELRRQAPRVGPQGRGPEGPLRRRRP